MQTAAGDKRRLRVRFHTMAFVAMLVFAGLVARLFQLQVLEGENFARKAERNFTDSITVPAPRGRVFAAGENLLARDRPAYALFVTARPKVIDELRADGRPVYRRDPVSDEDIVRLASLLDFADLDDEARFVANIKQLREDKQAGRYAVSVRGNLSWDEYARIQTREGLNRWVEIRESAIRHYSQGPTTASITGYMREISPEQLDASPQAGYRPGDRVGKTGIERQWENYLRGRVGRRSRVVNALGIPLADPPAHALAALPLPRDPIPGQDIHLSLDLDLQREAYETLADTRAAGVVALEVNTGRILAMVSVPVIDPNRWEQPITTAVFREWLESPFKPFVDKTVQEIYFPGSTYKVVSALAVLEDPSFDPEEEIECEGYIDYGGRRHRDSHRHGTVNLESAIVQSCNVYFWHLTMNKNLTLAKMERMARRLGMGDRTGLGINSEAKGIVPTEALESRQGRFQRGVLLNSAIGQGNVKATVLQVGVLYAALANGGRVVTPSLVDRIETYDGKVVLDNRVEVQTQPPVINAFDLGRIRRGLWGVVNDPLGTAYSQRPDSVVIAGKTGTAEVGKRRRRKDPAEQVEGWDTTKDHAWFAGFAPYDDPEVVVVALVAHGGAGADAAAPIVTHLLEYYLGTQTAGGSARPRAVGVPPPLPGASHVRANEEGGAR
ncbi:MAG: penicillin-binding protein 2 [Myxococcales bacterium FL481]|nr:MAG: penicillin-binding protein 2 [Myxococcales bacterium FL481]